MRRGQPSKIGKDIRPRSKILRRKQRLRIQSRQERHNRALVPTMLSIEAMLRLWRPISTNSCRILKTSSIQPIKSSSKCWLLSTRQCQTIRDSWVTSDWTAITTVATQLTWPIEPSRRLLHTMSAWVAHQSLQARANCPSARQMRRSLHSQTTSKGILRRVRRLQRLLRAEFSSQAVRRKASSHLVELVPSPSISLLNNRPRSTIVVQVRRKSSFVNVKSHKNINHPQLMTGERPTRN